MNKYKPKKSARYVNGYRLIYFPEFSRAMTSKNWYGYVYEHIQVMEKYLGRSLLKSEVVHHLDKNRANNRKENLLVIDKSQHVKIHKWLEKGAPFEKSNGKHGVNSRKSKVTNQQICCVCERTLQERELKYCSNKCKGLDNRKVERPTKEQLKNDIEKMSWLALGRKYKVSDNAVRKWAKAFGLL